MFRDVIAKLQESRADLRQDSASLQEVLDGLAAIVGQINDNVKLELVLAAALNLKTPSPADAAGVAEALKGPTSRLQALENYGPDWLDKLIQSEGNLVLWWLSHIRSSWRNILQSRLISEMV